jgi:hypothetical protein
LDAAGVAEPWQEKPKKFWEKPAFGLGAAAAAIVALIACLVLVMQVSKLNTENERQRKESVERPIPPSTSKRSITVTPARNGPPANATLTISHGEFAELKVDLSWARYASYRVAIQRVDQGRVGAFDGLEKDSNGHLRLSLNAGAFGPGDYQVAIEGLTLRRETIPVAWFRIRVEARD